MSDLPDEIEIEIERLLDLIRSEGSSSRALSQLVDIAYPKLLVLAGQMLKSFPDVQRFEEAEDVLHRSWVRILRAIEKSTPKSSCHFFNLARMHLRWVLMERARYYRRKLGQGGMHQLEALSGGDEAGTLENLPDRSGKPSSPDDWAELRLAVISLPKLEREVVELRFCEELTWDETAAILGVSPKTVQRRWAPARWHLFAALGGEWPS